jgi:hypothetical protein
VQKLNESYKLAVNQKLRKPNSGDEYDNETKIVILTLLLINPCLYRLFIISISTVSEKDRQG